MSFVVFWRLCKCTIAESLIGYDFHLRGGKKKEEIRWKRRHSWFQLASLINKYQITSQTYSHIHTRARTHSQLHANRRADCDGSNIDTQWAKHIERQIGGSRNSVLQQRASLSAKCSRIVKYYWRMEKHNSCNQIHGQSFPSPSLSFSSPLFPCEAPRPGLCHSSAVKARVIATILCFGSVSSARKYLPIGLLSSKTI